MNSGWSKQPYRSRICGSLAVVLLATLGIAGPLPAQTSPNPTTANAQDQGYVLGVGDRLRMDVFNVPDYGGEYRVLSDGSLNLPMIGAVRVQGLTIRQAAQVIGDRYLTFLQRPNVSLSLLEARPITVAIAGEVLRPGSHTLTADANGNGFSLTTALQQAGGVTRAADLAHVQIRRARASNAGSPQLLTVNLWQLVRAADLQQDVLLRDGDTIMIPTAPSVSLEEAQLLANSTFAVAEDSPIQVAVVGEVNRPGPHTLTPSQTGETGQRQVPTVTSAIQEAGGITQSADIRNIELRRLTRDGTTQTLKVNFWDLLQSGDLQQDVPLQAGDTIVIPTATALTPEEIARLASASFSANEMTVNVVGEVKEPGAIAIPPNTPLNQAILAAGGFSGDARRGSVQLIRLNPDGTVSRSRIEIDFTQGLNSENNPSLRPNDTIVVGRSGLANLRDALGSVLSPVTSVLQLLGL